MRFVCVPVCWNSTSLIDFLEVLSVWLRVEQHLGCHVLEVTIRQGMTVEMSYVGECVWQWHVWWWIYEAVVLALHIWLILWAHPWLTFLYEASAASVPISTMFICESYFGLIHGCVPLQGFRCLCSDFNTAVKGCVCSSTERNHAYAVTVFSFCLCVRLRHLTEVTGKIRVLSLSWMI